MEQKKSGVRDDEKVSVRKHRRTEPNIDENVSHDLYLYVLSTALQCLCDQCALSCGDVPLSAD